MTAERTFSALKIIKTYNRSTQSQDPSFIRILSIEQKILNDLKISPIL